MELIKEREQHKELQQEQIKLLKENSPPKDRNDNQNDHQNDHQNDLQIPQDGHANMHDISKDISEILERQMHSP